VANTCNHRCTTRPPPPHHRPNPRKTGDVWQLGEFLHLRRNRMTANAMDTVWRRCAAVGYAERRASAVLIVLIVAVKHSNGSQTYYTISIPIHKRFCYFFLCLSSHVDRFIIGRKERRRGGMGYRQYAFNNLLPSTLAKR
jgi:hypothetical protein